MIIGFLRTLISGSTLVATAAASIGLVLLFLKQRSLIYPSSFPEGARTICPLPADVGINGEVIQIEVPNKPKQLIKILKDEELYPRFAKKIYNSLNYVVDSVYNIIGLLRFKINEHELNKKDMLKLNVYHLYSLKTIEEKKLNSKSTIKKDVLIWFHGNAGNIGHRLPEAKSLMSKSPNNLEILMVDYRGFGLSEGTPYEEGIISDSISIIEWCKKTHYDDWNSPFLYGQSIGGAVVIQSATQILMKSYLNNEKESPIKGLILENTFTSLPKLVEDIMPLFIKYLSFMLIEIWNSNKILNLPNIEFDDINNLIKLIDNNKDKENKEELINKIKELINKNKFISNLPIQFLSGGSDEIIPVSHMDELFKSILKSKLKLFTLNKIMNNMDNKDVKIDDFDSIDNEKEINKVNKILEDCKISILNNKLNLKETSFNYENKLLNLYFKRFSNGHHNDMCLQYGFNDIFMDFINKYN